MTMDPSLIRIIGTTGKEGKGENQFAQPRGICIDSVTKEIFVVDCNNHRIQVYHLTSLAYIRQIGKGVQGDAPGSLNYAVGICMDDANQIFVADTNNHRVVVFNRITGGHVRNIGSQGTAPGMLFSPYGVCVDDYEGVLYVADYDNHRVQAFNKNSGEFIRIIGLGYGSGDGQLNQPIVICIDYEFDHLLVADYSNNRIAVFDKESGAFLRNVGTDAGPNNLSGPRGLCISKEANILFVADRENHRIQLYDKATYAFLRSVGNGMGTSLGQFQRPMEICVNVEEGVLLVVDGYNHRVQIMEIPELQVEKRRLKAAAQSKAEAELRGKTIPKPSMLAVTTQFTGRERVHVDPHSRALRISFEGLGPLYDMLLPQHDVPLLLAHLAAHNTREGAYNYNNAEEKHSPASTPLIAEAGATSTGDALIQRQAELFLSILESLCPEPASSTTEDPPSSTAESPAYMMVAPALFALHSLLERGWAPQHLSVRVITLLAGFLSNISSGIVSESERAKVLEAIVSLLRAAVAASADSLSAVLDTVLTGLSAPVKYHLILGKDTLTVPGAENNHVSVLMAYFELLGHIFVQGDKCHDSTPPELSPVKRSGSRGVVSPSINRGNLGNANGLQSPSGGSAHERRRQGAQQRAEILQFVFGTSFMRSLSDIQASKSKAPTAETVRTPTASVPALNALGPADPLGNLVAAGEDMQGQEHHPAFAADPRVQARSTPSKPSPASGSLPRAKEESCPEVSVPSDLCSIIGTVFALRQRRKIQKSVSLNEFCRTQKGASAELSPDATAAGRQDVLYHRESHATLQLKLFQSAATYLQTLRSEEDQHLTSGSDALNGTQARRSRGGRNIWRPTEPLAVGDLLDAQDKEKCWFESIIQEVHEDGGVKVHFMGWGSKWDDIVSPAELTSRLAVLNSKTKNWRADLFKGGLIEIKCNDDPINQKWMWGKITALDLDEAWVEVSYLFSNEPTVVKRAWLFGETICPVGMHTKDKSKAAAALLVRPLKKVEDIIKEKTGEGQLSDEFMFFDRADDYEEPEFEASELSQHSLQSQGHGAASGFASAPATNVSASNLSEGVVDLPHPNTSGASTPFLHLRGSSISGGADIGQLIKTAPADVLQHVSVVGLSIMECLMSELLSVTLEAEAEHGARSAHMTESDVDALTPHTVHAAASHQFLFDTALNLIALIAATPFRHLLVPYFTRVATFHSGMRARLVSGGLLTSKVTSILHSGLKDFDPIISVLDHFKELSGRYCSVIEQALGASISATALREVTSRIVATVDRCGVTQIANDLIEYILKQENLRYELFAHFVGEERFGESSTKLRKILSYLFKTASRAESTKFQALFEGSLMKRELSRLDFTPKYTNHSVCAQWAWSLIGALTSIYESAQSVSRLELLHIPQCHLAAERALLLEFEALQSEQVVAVALALATVLNCLLDPSYRREDSPGQKIAALKGVLVLQKIIMSEELLHHFGPAFEAHLAHRLLSGAFPSIAAERSVLEALPLLPRAAKLLTDIAHASTLSPDFSKYLMAGIDNDKIEYTPVLGMVLERRQISVQVLCHSTWGRYARFDLYANLRLPEPMRTIQTHFDEFYKTTARQTKGSCSRRLTWCHGAGQVVLTFHQPCGGQVDLRVNEAQAAVLWAFNQGRKTKSVQKISDMLNLSLEEVRGALASLSDDSLPVPLLTAGKVGEIEPGSVFALSDALINGDFADAGHYTSAEVDVLKTELDYCTNAAKHNKAVDVAAARDWRSETLDACVMRVLKLSARRAVGRSGVLTSTELVEGIHKELQKRGQRKNTVYSESEVLRRADHLASLGYIDKLNLSAPRSAISDTSDCGEAVVNDLGVAAGYAYLPGEPEPATSSIVRPPLLASREDLFLTLVELADAAGTSSPAHSPGVLETQSDSGEGEGKGDCDESKLADTPTADIQSVPTVSEESGAVINPTERVLTSEQLMHGIVNWTSSVRPIRPIEQSATVGRDSAEADGHSAVALAGTKSTTPPRSERRLSNRFGSAMSSPLRFGESPKMASGGSESKSGYEARSPHQHKLSASNSPAGAKMHLASPSRGGVPRPPPTPLMGSTPMNFTGVSPQRLKTFATVATAQLKVINERVHATLGETVSQLNTLLYQHHLSQLDPAVRKEIYHFPPPSMEPYLAHLNKAFSVDVRDLNDWPELHRELFFALPVDLIVTICRKYIALLASPVDALLDPEAAKELWNTRFPLLVPQTDTTESEGGGEDSKQTSTSEATTATHTTKAALKLSLYEYVFSTFECSHPRSLVSSFGDPLETPARTGASNSNSPGNSGAKSDKRRARHRFARPSSASPNTSRSARGSSTEDPTLRTGLTSLSIMSANLLSDHKSSPFGISFGADAEGINPEYNHMLSSLEYHHHNETMPELVLAPEFQSEDLSHASSRSSSRSNSNGDFTTVSQLMQSIELELQGNTSRGSPSASSATAPVLSFGESFVADKKDESAARKSTSRSLLAPLPSGFLFKPEHKMFMPPGYYTSDTMEALGPAGSKSYNVSLSRTRAAQDGENENDGKSAETTNSDSLQDLLRAYHSAFQKHLQETFREAWTDRTTSAETSLSACTMVRLVTLLLHSAALRVSEMSLHSDKKSHGLWFVRERDVSLNTIFDAAISALGCSDGVLGLDSFGTEVILDDIMAVPSTTVVAEEIPLSPAGPDGAAAFKGNVTRHHSVDHFAYNVATALNQPVAAVLPQLARHHWNADLLLDGVFSKCSSSHSDARDGPMRTYLRLSESAADMFTRGIDSAHKGKSVTECEVCSVHTPCEEVYALRCRHFACGACWAAHIEKAVGLGAGHITCICCTPGSDGQCDESAGLDLVSAVCGAPLVGDLVANQNRIYANDFDACNEPQSSEKETHLRWILLQSRSECISPSKPPPPASSGRNKSVPASPAAHFALPVHSTTQVGSPHRGLLPPARVRSPGNALLRTGGGTPNRPTSPRGERESILPRIFSGLSPFNVPRIATFIPGIGTDAGVGVWASDTSEGQTSKYLLETKIFMRSRAAELQDQLRRNQSEAKFDFISHQLCVLTQYLRAVTLVEYVESLHIPTERGTTKTWLHCIHEALESLRDLLIVSNIKIRSKWMTSEGLTENVAREAVACLRTRMLRLVAHLHSEAVHKRYARFDVNGAVEASREGLPPSLVIRSGTDAPPVVVKDLFAVPPAPWVEFGNAFGCKVLIDGLTSQRPPEKSPGQDKLSECRQLIEELSRHPSMSQNVLLARLKTIEELISAGFQTVLFANNICPVLMNLCNEHTESLSVCHMALSLMEKLCHQSSPCAQALVEEDVWGCWVNLLSKRRTDPDVCVTCSNLMQNLLNTPEEVRRAALELFDHHHGYDLLISVLHTHQSDVQVCRAVHSAVLQSADKTFNTESSFVRSGMCEVLISSLLHFSAYPGVRLQFVTLLERLSVGNKFMQERLLGLEVFENLIEIINDHAALDAPLLKQTCVAVSALASTYHAGQTKFATMGGCKAICFALRVCQDLSALTSVLRTVATLALRNSYVQDFFQLESVVELLLAKRDEITALAKRSASFDTKSKANLLLLSLEFALDTVRIPASHHSSHQDLTTIAAIAGMRRAGGRLSASSMTHTATSGPRGRPGRVSADFSDHEQEESRGDF